MNAELRPRPIVGLTARQTRAYAYIWRRLQAGSVPSYEEIAAELGVVSKSNVAHVVSCLVDRGYLLRRRHSARSLHLAPGAPVPVEPMTGGALVAFTSPLAADLVARAQSEGRDPSALLEEAVALYLGRSL